MSSTKIIQYIHRPNMTELGLGNTNDNYMLVDAKTDISGVFPPGESVTVFNSALKTSYTLKSSKGNEFRINQLGNVYRDLNVKPGDEVIITHFNSDGEIKNYISVHNYNRVEVRANVNGSEIVNLDRLAMFSTGDRTFSFLIYVDNQEKEMTISFLESRKKRTDSPSETDYYNVNIGGETLSNGQYYINIDDIITLIPMSPKSEYNQVILDETPSSSPQKETAGNRQVIYYGAPGTGKSFEINRLTKGKNVIRTTFHPDSDYSTFVGAYKPTTIEVPVRDVTGKVIIENGDKVKESRIIYEFVEQAFLQSYIKAWEAYTNIEAGKKVAEQYLVIEEINRGNCAQIFGDLFQLLDRNRAGFSDYPIRADKDMKKLLEKVFKGKNIADADRINAIYKKDVVSQILSGDILLLPDNLYIWASMNTSDQSLFPIDSAFKRRWDWKYIPISEGKTETGEKIGYKLKIKDNVYDWWTFLERINKEIGEQTKSEDKKLGYFFCKANDGIINSETFVSKVVFYLWNDVFKDQDVASIFSDGNEELTFSMFYDTDTVGKAIVKENKIEVLLKNLGLEPIMTDFSNSFDVDEEDDIYDEEISNNSRKDSSRYSINGEGNYIKKRVPFQAVSLYVKEHPEESSQDVVNIWSTVIAKQAVITSEDYQRKLQNTTDEKFKGRYYSISLNNGEIIYVYNQYTIDRINDFISKVNSYAWNIRIEKASE